MKKILAVSLMFATTLSAAEPMEPSLETISKRVVEIHMRTVEKPVVQEARKRKIQQMPLMRSGLCSGAFIDAFGNIITARHCVEGFDQFEVVTYDQRVYKAQVLAVSPIHDLALIHIDRLNTPFFDPSNDIQVGTPVSILGSPLGITGTLSQGVVAKLHGDITLVDCSVLPGNSGGPVFDRRGKLVGVATAGFVVMMGMTHLNLIQSIDAVYFFVVGALGRNR